MKAAQIYKLKDRYIITSQSKTKEGFSIASEPYLILDSASTMGDLAEKLIEAMNASKTEVIYAGHDAELENFLYSLGLKKLGDLQKNSLLCLVREVDDEVQFRPMVNLGSRKGFVNRNDKKIVVSPTKEIDSLANSLVEALSLCE